MPGIWELRRAVADLYNQLFRQGKPSQYTERNVCISGGGRMSLTRAVAALDARVQSQVRVEQEAQDQASPRAMRHQVVVVRLRHRVDLGQPVPRHRGKIVVFVVIPDVQRGHVQRAVVAVGLLGSADNVVLLDPAAAKRMQSYLTTFAVFILLSAGIGAYGWRTPEDATVRMALLTRAKPASKEIQELMALPPAAERETEEAAASSSQSGGIANVLLDAEEASALTPELRAAYDRFEPRVELNPDTRLGTVVLSSTVTDEYKAINPANVFGEGFYTLYATFDYSDMADGMAWAWVWRQNGEVIDGGNE